MLILFRAESSDEYTGKQPKQGTVMLLWQNVRGRVSLIKNEPEKRNGRIAYS